MLGGVWQHLRTCYHINGCYAFCPMPFRSLGLDAKILQAVQAAGYTEPTPIQSAAIPPIIAGHDLIGIAQTGTGKTAAFTLPILTKLATQPPGQRRGSLSSLHGRVAGRSLQGDSAGVRRTRPYIRDFAARYKAEFDSARLARNATDESPLLQPNEHRIHGRRREVEKPLEVGVTGR